MDLKIYLNRMQKAERDAFARRCDTTPGHMRNVAYGSKSCSENLALNIERESGGAVPVAAMRPDLAQNLEMSGYRRCLPEGSSPPSRPRPLPSKPTGQGAPQNVEAAPSAGCGTTAAVRDCRVQQPQEAA